MIIGCSKELLKIDVQLDDVDLHKLYSHELFGLYLTGQISFGKLKELFGTKYHDTSKFITKIAEQIEGFSNKDDSLVEYEIW
jgi:hypothetical protein